MHIITQIYSLFLTLLREQLRLYLRVWREKIIKANNCNKLIIEVNYWLIAPCSKSKEISVNCTHNLYFFRYLHKIFVRVEFSCRYLFVCSNKHNSFFFGNINLLFGAVVASSMRCINSNESEMNNNVNEYATESCLLLSSFRY